VRICPGLTGGGAPTRSRWKTFELEPQLVDGPEADRREGDPVDVLRHALFDDPYVLHALRHDVRTDRCLLVRNPCAGAQVRTDAERHVVALAFLAVARAHDLFCVEVAAEDVELLGVGEDARVVVGGPVDHVHQRAGGNLHAVHLDVERVVSWLPTDRRRMAQRLVESRVPQCIVGEDRGHLVGMLQQQVPHVENRTARRFAATSHDERDVRRDLLGRQVVAVDDRLAQLGNDVGGDLIAVVVEKVLRRRATLFDDFLDEVLEVLAGHQTLLLEVAATDAAHHVLVPVEEAVLGVVREAEHLTDHADRKVVGESATEFDDVLTGRRIVFRHSR
jgi:hypothetical protein